MVLNAVHGQTAHSQETPPPQPPASPPAATEPDAEEVREQTIYIPYGKLRDVFEKQGRGVFLPYEQFQELWRAARANLAPAAEPKPPVGALVSEIASEATVSGEVVRVVAEIKLEILTEGWHSIPLRLADASILSAKIGDEPARLVFEEGAGYKLLIEHRGAEPGEKTLRLEYARPYEKAPGVNRVTFAAPQAPVNRWKIRIPQRGVKVQIQPLIAASQAPDDAPAAPDAEETMVLAFVGGAPQVQIEWTAKSEGAMGLAALVSALVEQQVEVLPSAVRTNASFHFAISRADVDRLRIEVPADDKVVNVHDPNVRQWSVETAEGKQIITVELFGPVQGEQNLAVEVESNREDQPRQELTVPAVRALDVARQQGLIAVVPAEGLRAEALRASGLTQVDLSELPPNLRPQNLAFAYRYVAVPAELSLAVEKIKPRIRATELVEVFLEPQQLTLGLNAVFEIDRAGVFQFAFDVPAGYDVRQVVGRPLAGAQAADVESWQVTGDPATRLNVNLLHKARGRVGLFVELARRLDDPNLLSPTGQSSTLEIAPPRVAAEGVESRGGAVVWYSVPSLAIGERTTAGLRRIALAEAYQAIPVERDPRFASLGPVDAYATGPDAASMSAGVTRREPLVSARQVLVVRVEPGVVRYDATIVYDVSFSAVRSLRLAVPSEFADQLNSVTPGLRQSVVRRVEAGDGKPAEEIWQFEGDNELLGAIEIHIQGARSLDELKVGQAVSVPLPHLRPEDVVHQRGQVVLAKTEALDLVPAGEGAGLRPIDPQHDLIVGPPITDAARAFEFSGDWKLDVQATLYQLEEVKRTSIERAVVRAVLTRSDEVAVQALYRLRSVRQRLAVTLPADARFDTQPLRINGRNVTLERGDKQYFVPLAGYEPDAPLLLELRYTMPLAAARLDLPNFPEEPAVQKVYVCAYLPEEWELLGSQGEWTDENRWRLTAGFTWTPWPAKSDAELLQWVREGVPLDGDPGEGFATAGRQYVFSTLRPAAAPDGSLSLATIDRTVWRGLLVAGIVLLGFILLPREIWARLAALAGLFAAIVVAGIFLPTFARHLLDGVAIAAAVVMLLIWLAAYFARGRRPFVAAVGASALAAAAPVAPAPPPDVAVRQPASESQPPSGEAIPEQGGAAP